MKELNNISNTMDTIKSVRCYEENSIIKIDYRVTPNAKLPKGKTGNRFRSSTSKPYSTMAMKYFEKHKFEYALEHYESLFQNLENKDEPTFGDVAELALTEAESNRRKTNGTKDYQRILKNDIAPIFWDMKLTLIKVKDIKAWQREEGTKKQISQSRFNKKFYVLKRVLDYSLENGYIETNPIVYVRRSSKLFKKQQKLDDNYFSKEQMRLILDDTCENGTAIDKAKHDFINTYMHVAFLTGARVGEIASLTWDDISFEDNLITYATSIHKGVLDVTKTDEVRVVPMVNELAKVLKKFKGNTDKKYIFINSKTGSYYKDTRSITDTYYSPLIKRLKLPKIVLYNTRHTFASVAVEKGIPITTVSKCLGHKSIEVTSRFYLKIGKINQDDIRNQLEILSA
ncbi:MAG: tyrosine-type recombinase/integrase [Helicobacteraceae bacterium]|nr:tyrosine-type recombinase/integrase [Helicobacteraceae bacterium]